MLRRFLVAAAVATLVMPGAVLAAPKQQATNDYAIVTLTDAPIATYEGGVAGLERTKPLRGRLDPSSPAYRAYQRFLANKRANYRAFLAQSAPAATIVAEYDTVLNGFAVKLNGHRPEQLKGNGVKSVGASWLYKPTMNVSVDVIRATAAWPALGGQSTAGSGIDVGIIDTGIREDHPFFACKGDIPNRVYASGVAGTGVDIVFNHGTHVAGTVAGCATTVDSGPMAGTPISGVAPGANLHDYNVFPGYGGGFVAFGGSAFSHDIARAVEDATDDGMEVINLSLGGAVQGPHDYLAEAINAAAAAGVVPAVAAGNSGPGAGTVESPGNALGALTAGASTNPHFIGISVTAAGSTFGAALGDFANFDPALTAEYVATTPADGCSAITNEVAGKIAVIDRGTCTFTVKVRNAETAGAAGVLVVNNVAGDPTAMAHDGTSPEPVIPAAMVSRENGAAMKAAPGTATVDGTDPAEFITDNADIIAGFSSRGPAPFLANVKPDVTAPGVNVLSAVFDEADPDALGWAMFSGTSMATPHVAGAAALLLALRGGPGSLSPADVKSMLGNNADRTVTDHVNGTTDPGVLARGGGRINVERANGATLTFDPMSLSFGSENGNRPVQKSITVTVRNLTGAPQAASISESDQRLSLSAGSLTVPANGTATFTVTLTGRGASGQVHGDVTVTAGGRSYLIPFWYSIGN